MSALSPTVISPAYETAELDIDALASPAALTDLFARDAAVNQSNPRRESEAGRRDWYDLRDGETLSEAITRVAREGDETCTARITKARAAVNTAIAGARALRPVLTAGRLTGQRFDLERVLAGDARPWSRWENSARVRNGSKIVSLYVTAGGNGHRSADQIAWAPIPGIVLADLLEAAGYRVEIWGVWAVVGYAGGKHLAIRSILKRADQPLDLVSVARICHPALVRGAMFGASMAAFGFRQLSTGYGSTATDANAEVFSDSNAIAVKATFNLHAAVAEIARVASLFE